jgi:two-component system response regulator AlgR
MSISLLIVDDEPLARERLKRLLTAHPDFECVDALADGRSVLDWFDEQVADAVLLDIEMPGMSGMEVAEHLQTLATPPKIVFATAYQEYAVQAFAVDAQDYLLKPVRPEDLRRALERIRHQLSGDGAQAELRAGARKELTQGEEQAAEAGAALINQEEDTDFLTVRSYQGLQRISLKDIYLFEADQKYVNVVHKGGHHLIDESLRQLETQYGNRFLRVHRSTLVSRSLIERLDSSPKEGSRIYLRGLDQGIQVSRRHLAIVRKALKGQ